jgi:hypothetical protein
MEMLGSSGTTKKAAETRLDAMVEELTYPQLINHIQYDLRQSITMRKVSGGDVGRKKKMAPTREMATAKNEVQ